VNVDVAATADDLPALAGRARGAIDGRKRVLIEGIAFDPMTEDDVVSVVRQGMSDGCGGMILTPNVDILRTLRTPGRRDIADSADVVVADGTPIVWASRLSGTPLPERVTGAALVSSLTAAAAEDGRSVYLLGGEEGVAERGTHVLQGRFPGIAVAGWHCPPHGFEDDAGQLQVIVDDLVDTHPDLVLVGLGFPKQERLAEVLQRHLPRSWFLGCGAGLAFLAGDAPRAPHLIQTAGMEWAYRLAQEPRRLARRYLVDDAQYAVAMLARAALHGARSRRSPA
jgi:N-acetylglucosaminyldiphosphoundecaprenol N-acetyl-beta-D-mannosaminyltransferase